MNFLRTLIFSIFFYGLSLVLVLLVPLVALLGGDALRTYAMAWVALMTWSARWIGCRSSRSSSIAPRRPCRHAGGSRNWGRRLAAISRARTSVCW